MENVTETNEGGTNEQCPADGSKREQAGTSEQPGVSNMKQEMDKILLVMRRVITDPVGFFGQMAKTGGMKEPLMFLAAMGLMAGIVNLVLSVVGLGMTPSLARSLPLVIFIPIGCVVLGFVGAGIVFVIWKMMGSDASYETSYRCVAYAAAIMPITQFVSVVPYIGGPAGAAWGTFLFVLASIHVQKIRPKLAWIVFGSLFVVSTLGMLRAERAARRFSDDMNERFGDAEDMTPEEAGKAAAQFFKSFNKEADE